MVTVAEGFGSWGASHKHSSTPEACSEKRAKLTPSPSQVAPRGWGDPGQTRISLRPSRPSPALWRSSEEPSLGAGHALELVDEDRAPERGRGDVQRAGPAPPGHRLGLHPAEVADPAAAVDLGVGVEHLAPEPGLGHAEEHVLARHRRQVAHHQSWGA